MDLLELKKLCSDWDLSNKGFSIILHFSLKAIPQLTHALSPFRSLAEEFEVSSSIVSRWASGVARPHPRIQKLIIASIIKRIDDELRNRDNNQG